MRIAFSTKLSGHRLHANDRSFESMNAGRRAANSTGINRPAEEALLLFLFQRCFFRCRLSVPKLKPRFLQNSLRRMPLLTNSVTSCRRSTRVRRLGSATFFSTVIELLQHRHYSANRCVAQTLTADAGALSLASG